MNHGYNDFKELQRFNLRLQHYAHNFPTPRIMKLGTFSFPESSTEIIKEHSRNSVAFERKIKSL